MFMMKRGGYIMENSKLITRALNYIETKTQNSEITIEDIAKHAGFSTDYFNRIFCTHTGFNVMEYVRFTRLKKASFLLRTTSRSILDIALECGYEAHESFARAFKKQYGKTPNEYRIAFSNEPLKYADTRDKTSSTRFLYEFPKFKHINSDELIDSLLEQDAKKHGISAIVMYDNNGTQFFYDNEMSNSCIGIDEFQKGIYCADVISESITEIAQIYKKISEYISEFCFYSDLSVNDVCNQFNIAHADYQSIKQTVTQYLYTGSNKEISVFGLTIQALSINDLPAIKIWASKYGMDWRLEETLTQRDVYNNIPSELPFGIFDGHEMVGVCRTSIYDLRGFRIGEIEGLCILDDYKKEDICKNIYSSIINNLLSRSYLPFVSHVIDSPRDIEDLYPAEFGFEPVKNIFCVYK